MRLAAHSCTTSARLRTRPHGRRAFQSIPLFYRALHILGTQRFRLPVRRYVLDLFDIRLDPAVVANMHDFGQSLPPIEPRVEEDKEATPQIVAPQPSTSTSTSTPDMRQTRSPGPPPAAPVVRPGFRSRRNTRIGAVGLGIAVPGIDGMASGAPAENAADPQTYDYAAMERARNAALGQLHSAVEELRVSRENEERERERKERERKEKEREKLVLLTLDDDPDKRLTKGIAVKPKEQIIGFDV